MTNPVHDSVMILADRYLDESIALLALPYMDEEAVHDLRVLMKQLRALTRLYSSHGARTVMTGINSVLRDVARVFSAQRDAHVLVETLEQVASASDRTVAARLREISREMTEQTGAVTQDMSPANLIADLQWVRSRWRLLQRDDAAFLTDALTRSYRRCRKTGRMALRRREPHELHEWRKRVKYFYYQLSVVEMADPWLTGQKEQLRRLGSMLGKVHDLDVLEQYLCASAWGNQPQLLRRIHQRRVRLVKKAKALYVHAFSQSSKSYRRKLETS